jgi:hypothetical protein
MGLYAGFMRFYIGSMTLSLLMVTTIYLQVLVYISMFFNFR